MIINLLIDIKLNHSFLLLTWFIDVPNGHNYDVIKMVIKLMDVNIRFNVYFCLLLYYQISKWTVVQMIQIKELEGFEINSKYRS